MVHIVREKQRLQEEKLRERSRIDEEQRKMELEQQEKQERLRKVRINIDMTMCRRK